MQMMHCALEFNLKMEQSTVAPQFNNNVELCSARDIIIVANSLIKNTFKAYTSDNNMIQKTFHRYK